MDQSRIQAVDHIHLEAPFGIEDDLRWFYGKVAELEEIGCDQTDGPALCFKSERIELRIRFSQQPRIESIACRLTIGVLSLTEVSERLAERKWDYTLLRGLMFTDRRVETLDPAGNRVTLRRHWPVGLV